MQIEYVKDVKSNLDIANQKLLRASILRIVKQSAITNHLEFSLTANNFYETERINIVFKKEHVGLNNNLVVITNYRIINISQSIIDSFIHGEQTSEEFIKDNLLFIDLTACQDNFYEGKYSLILNYGNKKKLIIDSETEDDATFIKSHIKPLILENNDKMVEAYNNLIEKTDNQPFEVSSLKIDPEEKTIQEIIREEEKEQVQASSKAISKSNDNNQFTGSQISNMNGNCHYSFGPAPIEGYHQVNIIYAQSPKINWINNTESFTEGMDKALNKLQKLLKPDEFVYNLQFTTQNMGDTVTVNLAGDLYKKDF